MTKARRSLELDHTVVDPAEQREVGVVAWTGWSSESARERSRIT